MVEAAICCETLGRFKAQSLLNYNADDGDDDDDDDHKHKYYIILWKDLLIP